MKTITIENSAGWKFHVVIVEPTGRPIGHIHLLHGMAEHIGRYEHFMQQLAVAGYVVTGHEHRGHGNTAQLNGVLGHFGDDVSINDLVDDVEQICTKLRQQYMSLPFILFGHSMGSFIGRGYLQRSNNVHAAIFSGTGADPGLSRIGGQLLATLRGRLYGFNREDKLLNELAFGGYNKRFQPTNTKFDWLSGDVENVKQYVEDPLCGFIPTTGFFHTLFQGIGAINQNVVHATVRKNLPLLFVSGSDDPVGNYGKGVWQVAKQFERAQMTNVTVMLYEGGRHEMLNELNKEEVYQLLIEWMKNV